MQYRLPIQIVRVVREFYYGVAVNVDYASLNVSMMDWPLI